MTELPQQGHYSDNPRPDVAPFIPRDARSALDVGCGAGGFGATLRRVLGPKARIVGVDPVSSNVERSRVDHGFDAVYEGYFPAALESVDEKFDLIVFNDVLEHVADPWSMLDDVREHLTSNGRVLAAIPSVQYLPVIVRLLKGRWDYTDEGPLDRTHVRFFTFATAREMFENKGYEVELAEGANSMFPARRFGWLLKPLIRNMQYVHVIIVARPRPLPNG